MIPRPVIVVWKDAHAGIETHSYDGLSKMGALVTHTIGFLVCENEEGILLTNDTYKDEELEDQTFNYGFIPHSMIVKIVDLPVPLD